MPVDDVTEITPLILCYPLCSQLEGTIILFLGAAHRRNTPLKRYTNRLVIFHSLELLPEVPRRWQHRSPCDRRTNVDIHNSRPEAARNLHGDAVHHRVSTLGVIRKEGTSDATHLFEVVTQSQSPSPKELPPESTPRVQHLVHTLPGQTAKREVARNIKPGTSGHTHVRWAEPSVEVTRHHDRRIRKTLVGTRSTSQHAALNSRHDIIQRRINKLFHVIFAGVRQDIPAKHNHRPLPLVDHNDVHLHAVVNNRCK